MTVDRVIFHHEGAGAPTNNTARPLEKSYSIAIGVNTYQLANTPEQSFKTNGTIGHSLQVVFTGNRDVWPLTDNDIRLVRRAVDEAKTLGWVTKNPTVQFHGDTDPGTACPGKNVKERRFDLELAVSGISLVDPAPAPWPFAGDDMPKPDEFTDALTKSDGAWKLQASGGVHTERGAFYGSYLSLPAAARQGSRWFPAITAPKDDPSGPGYTLWGSDGTSYTFQTPQ